MAKDKICPVCEEEPMTLPSERAEKCCVYCKTHIQHLAIDEPIENAHEIISTVSGFKRIIIPSKIWTKMQYYCNMAPGEVSGFGKVKQIDSESLLFTNIIMLPQENTAANTKITADDVSNFMLKMARRGQSLEGWQIWWHTHHDFGTFWSATDTGNIDTLKKILATDSFLISVETNKKGDVIARYDDMSGTHPLYVSVKPFERYNRKLRNQCYRQVKRMVKENKFYQNVNIEIVNPRLFGSSYSYYGGE